MTRRILVSVLAVLLATAALAGPASALPASAQSWHRLNPLTDSGLPEHEQLHCLTAMQWVCRYDKEPEPQLGFTWDRTIGMFHGRDVSLASWECPDWFPGDVCDAATQVVAGNMKFANAEGSAFHVWNELIFTEGDDVAPLYVHWPDFGFACAWYGSLEEAMAADPAMEGNCFFAP